jgi:hypothetical protein
VQAERAVASLRSDAATAVGEGGAEMGAVLAGAAAVAVGESGAERDVVLACTAGLDARTSALGGHPGIRVD